MNIYIFKKNRVSVRCIKIIVYKIWKRNTAASRNRNISGLSGRALSKRPEKLRLELHKAGKCLNILICNKLIGWSIKSLQDIDLVVS